MMTTLDEKGDINNDGRVSFFLPSKIFLLLLLLLLPNHGRSLNAPKFHSFRDMHLLFLVILFSSIRSRTKISIGSMNKSMHLQFFLEEQNSWQGRGGTWMERGSDLICAPLSTTMAAGPVATQLSSAPPDSTPGLMVRRVCMVLGKQKFPWRSQNLVPLPFSCIFNEVIYYLNASLVN